MYINKHTGQDPKVVIKMIITSHGIQVFGRHLYQHNNINVTVFKIINVF